MRGAAVELPDSFDIRSGDAQVARPEAKAIGSPEAATDRYPARPEFGVPPFHRRPA